MERPLWIPRDKKPAPALPLVLNKRIRKLHLASVLSDVRQVVRGIKSIAAEIEPVVIHAYVLLHLYRSLFNK